MRWSRRFAEALGVLVLVALAAHVGLGQLISGGDKPAAVVNGEPISRADLEAATRRAPAAARSPELQRELLDLLIDERLLRQFLKKAVPVPAAALVRDRVAALENSLKTQGKTLADYCADTGQTEAQLEAGIVATLQWNAYVRKQAGDQELRRCFEANRPLFEGVQLRASHIALQVPTDADDRAHQAAIRKLLTVRKEVLGGADFAAAAKQVSQDASTAPRGGDLGYFPPYKAGQDPFMDATLKLKVGEVSEVVRTPYGYHLIKMTDRKPGKPTTFDEARNEALVLYAEELRQKVITEQREAARIEVYGP